jgi:predicted nucleotide-binding protein
MPKKIIFLGSSTAAKKQAQLLAERLSSPSIAFLPWWDAFTPGRTLLEDLDSIRQRVDGALLLFSPESETTIRTVEHSIPALNVIFELGYFYGHFGKRNVAMVKYGQFYLPSDLGGYIYIYGRRKFIRGGTVSVLKRTKAEFLRWSVQLEARKASRSG